MKRVLNVAATYVGAVVGAGFASGQETALFFAIHGSHGIRGLVLAGLLFTLFGMVIMGVARATASESYTELLDHLLGRTLGRLFSCFFTLFLLVGLAVMLSGSRTVVQEHMGLPGWIGLALCLVSVLLALSRGNRGVLALNAFLMPFLLIPILVACVPYISPDIRPGPAASQGSWVLSSLLYFSYNAIIVIGALVPLSSEAPPWAGAFGGVILGAAGLFLGIALIQTPEALGHEIPMMHLAMSVHPVVGWTYGLALWTAMTTTAVAASYALSTRLAAWLKAPLSLSTVLILLVAVPLGTLRFSHLVATLYPLWGYLSLGFFALALGRTLCFTRKRLVRPARGGPRPRRAPLEW